MTTIEFELLILVIAIAGIGLYIIYLSYKLIIILNKTLQNLEENKIGKGRPSTSSGIQRRDERHR
jgi:hypothetical protein